MRTSIHTRATEHAFYQRCLSLKSRKGKAFTCFLLVSLIISFCVVPGRVEASEFRIQPSITLSEEYNDNIFLATRDRSNDYISRVAPSIGLLYKVPLWDWDVSYLYDYRYYSRYNYLNTSKNQTHALNLTNHTRIKDEYIYLDVKDNYARVSLDPTRDYTQESYFINQTDSNTLNVNPYFIIRPTSQMTVTSGYTYSNTWYKDPAAVDQIENTVYTGLQQDLSRRSVMTFGIRHIENKNRIRNFTQDDAFVGQRYEYIDNSTLSVTFGNTWLHNRDAERFSQIVWDARLTHRYSTMTVTYETGLRFIPDPSLVQRREDRYLATIRRDVERTSLELSGGLLEYRNIANKHLENSTYLVKGTMSHALTTKTKIFLNVEADWAKDYLAYTKTERYLTGARLEHLLAENFTLAVAYQYTNVYSPDVYSFNYFNNRFTVELRKAFF